MKNIDITAQYKYFHKMYKKYIPPFYNDDKKIDIYPLLSYFKIIQNGEGIIKLGPFAYFDSVTGWLIIIVNKYAFRQSRYFYLQLFPNKRVGKRYLFGLKSNKKTVLGAIMTHVSVKASEQKHKSTRKYLKKSQIIAKQKMVKDKDLYFNMKKIDRVILSFVRKKKIRRYKPNWFRIYQMAKISKVYWKGII